VSWSIQTRPSFLATFVPVFLCSPADDIVEPALRPSAESCTRPTYLSPSMAKTHRILVGLTGQVSPVGKASLYRYLSDGVLESSWRRRRTFARAIDCSSWMNDCWRCHTLFYLFNLVPHVESSSKKGLACQPHECMYDTYSAAADCRPQRFPGFPYICLDSLPKHAHATRATPPSRSFAAEFESQSLTAPLRTPSLHMNLNTAVPCSRTRVTACCTSVKKNSVPPFPCSEWEKKRTYPRCGKSTRRTVVHIQSPPLA